MTSPYAVPLADLERSAHVPPEQQATGQAEPPPPAPIAPEEVERQALLRVAG